MNSRNLLFEVFWDAHNHSVVKMSIRPSDHYCYNRSSGHWPCVKSCLVGGRDKYSHSDHWPHYTKLQITELTKRLACSLMAQGTGVQSQVESYQRLRKMGLDTSLLNTQHFKIKIKGKVKRNLDYGQPTYNYIYLYIYMQVCMLVWL